MSDPASRGLSMWLTWMSCLAGRGKGKGKRRPQGSRADTDSCWRVVNEGTAPPEPAQGELELKWRSLQVTRSKPRKPQV